MRYVISAILLLTAIACESDTDKAQRLSSERFEACLPIESRQIRPSEVPAPTAEQYAKCDVARRNWARFMAGR